MLEIEIKDDTCWKCGEPFTKERPKTMHHILPVTILPVKNLKIPLHQDCHDIVTSNDMTALTSFAYALKKSADELCGRVNKLIEHVKI